MCVYFLSQVEFSCFVVVFLGGGCLFLFFCFFIERGCILQSSGDEYG